MWPQRSPPTRTSVCTGCSLTNHCRSRRRCCHLRDRPWERLPRPFIRKQLCSSQLCFLLLLDELLLLAQDL